MSRLFNHFIAHTLFCETTAATPMTLKVATAARSKATKAAEKKL